MALLRARLTADPAGPGSRIPAGRSRSCSTRPEASAGGRRDRRQRASSPRSDSSRLDDAPRRPPMPRSPSRGPSRPGAGTRSSRRCAWPFTPSAFRSRESAIHRVDADAKRRVAGGPRCAGRSRGTRADAGEPAGGGAPRAPLRARSGGDRGRARRARSTGWPAPPVAERDSGRFVGRRGRARPPRRALRAGARRARARSCPSSASLASGSPASSASFAAACGGVASWLEGQAMPFGRPMPFHPLIDFLRRACGIGERDEEATAAGRLQAYVLGLGDDLRPTLPFLRDLLALDPADASPWRPMDPNARRAGILDAVRRVLLRVAEREGAVLVIEDVHWADQATREFLGTLADSLATRRVLMILTARPGHPSRHRRTELPYATAARVAVGPGQRRGRPPAAGCGRDPRGSRGADRAEGPRATPSSWRRW